LPRPGREPLVADFLDFLGDKFDKRRSFPLPRRRAGIDRFEAERGRVSAT
jgi:hypothetical protein